MTLELYHGSRATYLLPVLLTSKPAQEKNGRLAELVFATHRIDQATLYAAPMPEGGSFLTTFSDEHDTLALFRAGTVDQMPTSFLGRVYTFAREGFEQVEKNPREWVRDSYVDLKHASVKEVTDYKQIMATGVQIFCLRDGVTPDILNPASP